MISPRSRSVSRSEPLCRRSPPARGPARRAHHAWAYAAAGPCGKRFRSARRGALSTRTLLFFSPFVARDSRSAAAATLEAGLCFRTPGEAGQDRGAGSQRRRRGDRRRRLRAVVRRTRRDDRRAPPSSRPGSWTRVKGILADGGPVSPLGLGMRTIREGGGDALERCLSMATGKPAPRARLCRGSWGRRVNARSERGGATPDASDASAAASAASSARTRRPPSRRRRRSRTRERIEHLRPAARGCHRAERQSRRTHARAAR